eukprot:CAMPEP_0182595492 /NCGR_PEP_ID=MMETSP1324-20130603/82356_1 /TAXON_ID=236786 /ORGANISM="Florenciella sp., Strain RCC1587" /LENGTH=113 /DNA_ID=CAMNT_0024813095 /DNA_START=35 /DNA_END=372 /DNA_ORIENTATION=+
MLEVMLADYSYQQKPVFFSKELSCYFDFEEGAIPDAWLRQFHHVILFRDPVPTLESWHRVALKATAEGGTGYFDPSEAGFAECVKIHQRVVAAGCDVMVIDADRDLMQDPEKT